MGKLREPDRYILSIIVKKKTNNRFFMHGFFLQSARDIIRDLLSGWLHAHTHTHTNTHNY